jgi:hypothetical protein
MSFLGQGDVVMCCAKLQAELTMAWKCPVILLLQFRRGPIPAAVGVATPLKFG